MESYISRERDQVIQTQVQHKRDEKTVLNICEGIEYWQNHFGICSFLCHWSKDWATLSISTNHDQGTVRNTDRSNVKNVQTSGIKQLEMCGGKMAQSLLVLLALLNA